MEWILRSGARHAGQGMTSRISSKFRVSSAAEPLMTTRPRRKHVPAVSDRERLRRVLFDEQHADAAVGGCPHGGKQSSHDQWGESERELVGQQARRVRQRAHEPA